MNNLTILESIIVYFFAIISAIGYIYMAYKCNCRLKENENNNNYLIYEDNEETSIV